MNSLIFGFIFFFCLTSNHAHATEDLFISVKKTVEIKSEHGTLNGSSYKFKFDLEGANGTKTYHGIILVEPISKMYWIGSKIEYSHFVLLDDSIIGVRAVSGSLVFRNSKRTMDDNDISFAINKYRLQVISGELNESNNTKTMYLWKVFEEFTMDQISARPPAPEILDSEVIRNQAVFKLLGSNNAIGTIAINSSLEFIKSEVLRKGENSH